MLDTLPPRRAEAEGSRCVPLDQAVTTLYAALRLLARRALARHGSADSLQPTGLVHEAYLGLRDQRRVDSADERQLLGVASVVMRRVLADRARSRRRLKRGGAHRLLPLGDEVVARTDERDEELVAVDLALERLSRVDARKARVVELMFFGGLTLAETAQELGVSLNTVKRDWSFAKLWILRETPRLAVGG